MSNQAILFTPGPVNLHQDVYNAMLTPMNHRSTAFADILLSVRRKLADLYPFDAECVVLSGSATYSLEAAVGTFSEKTDKLLVVSNGAYGRRLHAIANYLGRRSVLFESSDVMPIPLSEVEKAIAHSNPTHLLFVHHETSTGVLNDLPGIATLAANSDILLLVDDISSLGCEQVRYPENSNWVSVSSSAKALEGVAGVGTIAAPHYTWEKHARSNGFSFDLVSHREAQVRGEVLFTPAVSAFQALDVALDRLAIETVCGRRVRYRTQLDAYVKVANECGLYRVIPQEFNSSSIALLRSSNNVDCVSVLRYMELQETVGYYGLKPGDTNHLRLSSMGVHYLEHLTRLRSTLPAAVRQALR